MVVNYSFFSQYFLPFVNKNDLVLCNSKRIRLYEENVGTWKTINSGR